MAEDLAKCGAISSPAKWQKICIWFSKGIHAFIDPANQFHHHNELGLGFRMGVPVEPHFESKTFDTIISDRKMEAMF